MGVSRLEEYDSDEDFEKRDEDVKWIGKGVSEHGRVYYPGVIVDGSLELSKGDAVLVKQFDPKAPFRVATVGKLYQSPLGASAHVQWFRNATDSLLGNTADPQELFFTNDCKDVSLTQIWEKCKVETRLGSSSVDDTAKTGDFWAWHWHDGETRFEALQEPLEIPNEQEEFISFCEVCARRTAREAEKKPEVVKNKNKIQGVKWRGRMLRVGDGVMIPSNTLGKATGLCEVEEEAVEEQPVEQEIYTEHYRKKNPGEQAQTKHPLHVGQIVEIKKKMLKIRKFYRPGEPSCSSVRIIMNNFQKKPTHV